MAEYSGRDKRLAYLFDAVENVQVDDMTGASASTDGAHGLVPAPLAGDEDKFLKGDGTWATVQAGAGALSGLSDVDLSSPTDGQALVYDGTNSKWINGNVSGGGGGSARYKEVELWSGTLKTASGTAALSDSIKNFDQILIIWTPRSSNDAIYHITTPIAVSDVILAQAGQFLLDTQWYSNQFMAYISCCFSDAQTLTITEVFNATASTDIRIIKVLGIKWETMQTALIYSTEEREVGVWTDGRPLYQKTYHTVAGAPNTYNTLDLGISTASVSMVEITDCYVVNSAYVAFLTGYKGTTIGNEELCGFIYKAISGNIRFDYRLGSSVAGGDLSITIRYTKTTNVAGSGIWTTTGEYAHHYSTSEKVIGTWIDGKPLYERVFTGLSVQLNSVNWVNLVAITNVKSCQDVELYRVIDATTQRRAKLPLAECDANNGYIRVSTISSTFNDVVETAIVRYTKTTD